ncbi:hypothetical protein RRG08_039972 [Elysia crispata]|uniref:Uncharacterized protein n=1 Tax=Elysia crispata TaxID=231223 RepID=A0AAE0Z8Q1_9GAST|nr:hypothetical protein RRG08_039972 [Elysia crispata]
MSAEDSRQVLVIRMISSGPHLEDSAVWVLANYPPKSMFEANEADCPGGGGPLVPLTRETAIYPGHDTAGDELIKPSISRAVTWPGLVTNDPADGWVEFPDPWGPARRRANRDAMPGTRPVVEALRKHLDTAPRHGTHRAVERSRYVAHTLPSPADQVTCRLSRFTLGSLAFSTPLATKNIYEVGRSFQKTASSVLGHACYLVTPLPVVSDDYSSMGEMRAWWCPVRPDIVLMTQ